MSKPGAFPEPASEPEIPAVWFPAIRVGTGVDVFTERLRDGLTRKGIRAEITWLPRRSEHLPWTVGRPVRPAWANLTHVNSWLHRRFVPPDPGVVATVHHCVHEPSYMPHKSALQSIYHRIRVRPAENWLLHRADATTAVSRHTARVTSEAFGIPAPVVIHNGLPAGAHRSPDLGRPSNRRFRLLYVGSWSRRKGADLLSPIMQALGAGFELYYTADGRSKPQLPPNCHSIGRPDAEQLTSAYQDADALLFPTRLEGFGQVALEAMANGLPVISTDGSAIPEVVVHGVTGILCPVDDVRGYAAAALRLKNDQHLWQSMRAAALDHARSPRFGIDAMVEGYMKVYLAALRARITAAMKAHQ